MLSYVIINDISAQLLNRLFKCFLLDLFSTSLIFHQNSVFKRSLDHDAPDDFWVLSFSMMQFVDFRNLDFRFGQTFYPKAFAKHNLGPLKVIFGELICFITCMLVYRW